MKEAESYFKIDFRRITLGNLISIVIAASSVFMAYSNIKAELAVMRNDIAWIKAEMQLKDKEAHVVRAP